MFEVRTLPNGIRIVLERIPFLRSIAMGIWVANGSRNEQEETCGISHFIEHMLFKGTEGRSAKDIAEEMDAVGGQINAYTSKEYTCYYTRTLDTHIDIALDVLTDMFFHSKFADEDILKEKNVVLEEINMYEDSTEELVHDLLQETLWQGDPLGYPILGTEQTISGFNSSLLKQYYKDHYQPHNTVIAVAGNFDMETLYQKLEKHFSGWQPSKPPQNIQYHTSHTPKIIKKVKDIEQVHLCLGLPGIPLGSEDVYALTIFNTIFGGGMSSKLFQTIREDRGLAYSVYSYPSNYQDIGLFTIYAGMSVGQTGEVVKLILQEMEQMKNARFTEEAIRKTKEQLKSNYIIGLESTSSRMTSIGKSELLLRRIQTPDEIIQRIDEVTGEQIENLIGKIFDFSKLSAAAVGKVEQLNIEEMLRI